MGEKLVSEIVGRSAVKFSMFILVAVLLSLLSVSYASANIVINTSSFLPGNGSLLNYQSNINVTFSVTGNDTKFNCSVLLQGANTSSWTAWGVVGSNTTGDNRTVAANQTLTTIKFNVGADGAYNWTLNCTHYLTNDPLETNVSGVNMTFTIDTTPPTLTVNWTGGAVDLPWNGTAITNIINSSNANMMFNYTIVDNSSILNGTIVVDQAAGFLLTKNFSINNLNTMLQVNGSISNGTSITTPPLDQNLTGGGPGGAPPVLTPGPSGALLGAEFQMYNGAHNITFVLTDAANNTASKSYAVLLTAANVTQMEASLPYLLTGGAAAVGIIELKVYIIAADGGFARANGTMNPASNKYVWSFNKSAGAYASAVEFMIWNFTLSNANMSNMKNMSSNHSQPNVPPPGGSMSNNSYAMLSMLGFLEDSMYEHAVINMSMAQRYYYINFSTKSPNMAAPIYTVVAPCNRSVSPKNASQSIPTDKGCWINDTEGRALLFLDHFSGAGGVNDTTPPNITMNAPTTNGTWTNDNTTTINFTISDLGESGDFGINDSSINVTITITIAGTTYNYTYSNASGAIRCQSANATVDNNMSRTCWFTTNASVDGNYSVANITARDWMGNLQNYTFFYYVDTLAPTVMLETAGEYAFGNYTAAGTLSFNFTANDTLDSVINCTLFMNATSTNPTVNSSRTSVNGTQANFNVTMVNDGLYRWYLNCTDNASNIVTTTVANFTIDSKVPVITITSPMNNSFTNSTSVTITWSFVDQGNHADKVRWYSVSQGAGAVSNNSNATFGFPTSYSVAFTLLIEGLNNITITANDTFGNQGYNYTNITLDQTAPVLTFNHTPPSITPGQNINLNISWTELNPDNITILVNGVIFNFTYLYTNTTNLRLAITSLNFSIPTNGTWNGTNNVWARLCDAVGSCVNTGNFTVDVNDSIVPTVTYGYPTKTFGNFTNDNTTALNFSIYDAGGLNLSLINVTINGVAYNYTTNTSLIGAGGVFCSGSTGTTLTMCNLTTYELVTATNYSVNVTARDLAGNQNNSQGAWIFIDTLNPTNSTFLLNTTLYGHVLINWTNCSDGKFNSTRIDILRGTADTNSSFSTLASAVGVGASYYNDSSAVNGTKYYYKVRCYDEAGNYNDSAVQNATVNDTLKPAQVTNLNASGSGATATLTWSVVTVDVNGTNDTAGLKYKIYRGTTATCLNATNTTCWLNVANVTTATTNSTTDSVTSSATYFYVVTAIDDNGNENETIITGNNVTITLNYTAAATTTSSGGDGGGQTTTPTSSSAVAQSFIFSIGSGATKTLSITSDALAFTNVQISVTANADNVNIKVEKVTATPSAVGAPAGTVYQNLQITKTNLADTAIGTVKMQFRVEKTWLTEKGVKDSDVALARYADNKWNDLTTKKKTESDKYVYYEADSPGFSYFTVVAKTAAAAPVTPAPTTTPVTPTPTPTPTPEVTPTPTPAAPEAAAEAAPSNAWIVWTIVIVIVIAIIIGAVMMGKKKK
ncbi:PGF-pre-PGF domain-containing protein [Candidatus Woesearchaeota archaeon]|nr:PGF-pre-PGF domain-containing protein [Candidatus Woesearchaeota archaeon]